jgi:hypothetical protein
MSGEARIQISAACRSGGDYVGQQGVDVAFSDGAFSVNLVPTDACPVSGGSGSIWSSITTYAIGSRVSYSGGVYTAIKANTAVVPGADATWLLISPSYTVQWTSAKSINWKWTEIWVVPTSVTAVTVDSVKVYSVSLPSVPVPGIQGPAGLAPSGSGNQVLATPANGALGISALRSLVSADIPTSVGYWQTETVTYTNAAFHDNANKVTFNLTAVVPQNGWIDRLIVVPTTAFAGSGITGCTFSLGDGTTANIYSPLVSLTDAPSNTRWVAAGNVPATSLAGTNMVGTVSCNGPVGTGSATHFTQGQFDVRYALSVH